MLTVFQRGTSREQNSIMSVTMRIAGRGGTSHACCAMNSFRQSFWTVPPMPVARDAAHVGERDVEGEEDDRRTVDGHRRRDLVERDVREEDLHVAQRVDRDAAHADLAERRAGCRSRTP